MKCPYACKDKSLRKAVEASSTLFLDQKDGVYALKKDHHYYYQVQAQMKFSSVNYCDFVVWAETELLVQRIFLDEEFIDTHLKQATIFFKIGILPELSTSNLLS